LNSSYLFDRLSKEREQEEGTQASKGDFELRRVFLVVEMLKNRKVCCWSSKEGRMEEERRRKFSCRFLQCEAQQNSVSKGGEKERKIDFVIFLFGLVWF
jgi:hypothetical protein